MNQTIETGDIRKAGANLHKNDLLSTYTFAKVSYTGLVLRLPLPN